MPMPHSTQLDLARREGYLWTQPSWWGWSDSLSYPRQPKSREVTPRKLCKKEVLTLGVWGWRSRISKGFANEAHEEVSDEREVSTSLQWTLSHHWEVWSCGMQAWLTTLVGRVHDIFHVSQLKKCLKAPVDVVLPKVTPLKVDLT
jgi:hypothetical protein